MNELRSRWRGKREELLELVDQDDELGIWSPGAVAAPPPRCRRRRAVGADRRADRRRHVTAASSSASNGWLPGVIVVMNHCSEPGTSPRRSAGKPPARTMLDLPEPLGPTTATNRPERTGSWFGAAGLRRCARARRSSRRRSTPTPAVPCRGWGGRPRGAHPCRAGDPDGGAERGSRDRAVGRGRFAGSRWGDSSITSRDRRWQGGAQVFQRVEAPADGLRKERCRSCTCLTQSSNGAAGACFRRDVGRVWCGVGAGATAATTSPSAHSEVRKVRIAVVVDHDTAGADVAMHHASAVGRLQCAADLFGDAQHLLRLPAVLRRSGRQGLLRPIIV